MLVVVYTTGCPRCKILEKALAAANIDYVSVSDVQAILEKGFETVPQMTIGKGEPMNFREAMNWVKERAHG